MGEAREEKDNEDEGANNVKHQHKKEEVKLTSPAKSATKTKKRKKDPLSPKRPTAAFLYFAGDQRSKIKRENPDANFGDVSRLVGAAFKNLSDEARDKYVRMNQTDKERYSDEMAKYTAPPSSDDSNNDNNNNDDEGNSDLEEARKKEDAKKKKNKLSEARGETDHEDEGANKVKKQHKKKTTRMKGPTRLRS